MFLSKKSFNQKKVNKLSMKLVSIIFLIIISVQAIGMGIIINENNIFPIQETKKGLKDLKDNEISPTEKLENLNTETSYNHKNREINDDFIESSEDSVKLGSKDQNPLKKPLFSQIPTYKENNLNTQIKANESFILSKDGLNLNTTGSFDDSSLKDTTTIDFPSNGFTNFSQSYTIDNITASYNYSHIEYEAVGLSSIFTSKYEGGLGIQSVSTSFSVTEEIVNLTTIRLTYVRSGSPNGVVYISGDNSGVPNNTILGGQTIALEDYSGQNVTVSFSNPITLTKGTYHIVLNDTSSGSEFDWFDYYYIKDTGSPADNDDEANMYRIGWAGGGWTATNGDLYFSYEFIQLNDTDSSQLKEYITSPEEVDLSYNGTSLTAFSSSNLLLNGNIAEFDSNTSVTFDLQYTINYNSDSNPINLTTSFLIINGSSPIWNNSFTHNSIPSGSYTVSKRNITVYDVPIDWNGTNIYQNNSLFTDDPDSNSSISYTNGSSILKIQLDQQMDTYNWLIQFNSPNYINSLTLIQNNSQILAPRYQINSSDTLTINADLNSSLSGTNGSLFIYDYNDVLNHSQIDQSINLETNSLNFTVWDLTSLSNQSNINGTYNIVAQWLDSTQTKIGYLGVNIDIITQTEISGSTDNSEYVTGEPIQLSGNFSSFLNGTILDSVNMTYLIGWNSSVGIMSQSGSHITYTEAISTSSAPAGLTNITIYASLAGHVNRSITIPFRMIRNTTLNYLANNSISTSLTVYYNDKIALDIYYNDTSGAVSSSSVLVNGTPTFEETNDTYTLTFDTSTIPYSTTFVLNITASRTDYVSRELLVTFDLEETFTDINNVSTQINNSIIEQYFSNSSVDAIEIKLEYFDSRHNSIINSANLFDNSSSSDISINYNENVINNTWTIELDPKKSGTFPIVFTFDKSGYLPSSVIYTFQINITLTEIIIGGNDQFSSNGSTISVYYHNGTKDNISILMTFNDTIYNQILENATFTKPSNTGSIILIENQLPNGTYQIIIQPNATGTFNLQFSFDQFG
ncbi:MAG: hypothetical protein HeimC3_39040, partial [Candidatus Heimdallarchaeota archaeon LC_3]